MTMFEAWLATVVACILTVHGRAVRRIVRLLTLCRVRVGLGGTLEGKAQHREVRWVGAELTWSARPVERV